jgi:ribosomal protein L40E
MSQWYYARQGQRSGPVSAEQFKELASSGQILPSDSVWKKGMEKWVPAGSLKGLFPKSVLSDVPPPPPSVAPATGGKFCRNCGAGVAEQAVACMTCGLAPTNGAKFCRSCGAETNQAAVVCVKCGVSLTQAASPAAQGTAKSSSATVWPQFFESAISSPGRPGYWKPKPSYWIACVVGIVTIPLGVGFFISGFLVVAAFTSRGAWRNQEVVAAIRQNKG